MIAGIVAEYNPFHNGHLYHIEKTKNLSADYIVAVMSGNFVQRGECACLSKNERALMAVKNGVDVVLELPTPWANDSAESFARGSVNILSNFGIDFLSFGSEIDNKELLISCVKALENKEVNKKINENLSLGFSYPKSVSLAVGEIFSEKEQQALLSPNSTLSLEYIKELLRIKSDIDFFPILRKGASHDGDKFENEFASASYVRSKDTKSVKDFLPKSVFEILLKNEKKGFYPCSMKNNERGILDSLRALSLSEYSKYLPGGEDLSNRIFEQLKTSSTLEELYEKVKSKNVTHSKIRRSVLSLYLRQPPLSPYEIPPYIKVLAFSERGAKLLKGAKKNSSLPIITRVGDVSLLTKRGREIYDFECSATDRFAFMSEKIREAGFEKTCPIMKT